MNELRGWLLKEKKRRKLTFRDLGRLIGMSHTHIINVVNGKKMITWDFCAAVAEGMGLEHMEAFKMAGLLPENNEGGQASSPSTPAEEKESHHSDYTPPNNGKQ